MSVECFLTSEILSLQKENVGACDGVKKVIKDYWRYSKSPMEILLVEGTIGSKVVDSIYISDALPLLYFVFGFSGA